MSPVTRSSAPSPPTAAKSDALPSPRRAPHCTKCRRPRAGHPRSGCPFVDQSPSVPAARRPLARIAPNAEDGLSEGLSSLRIVSPTEEIRPASAPPAKRRLKRRLSVRFALVPEQTLASLSPTCTHLVEQLLHSGTSSNTVTPEDKTAHVLSWRKTLGDADPSDSPEEASADANLGPPSPNDPTPPLSRRMPCMLSTPTTSMTTTEPVSDQHIGGSALNMNETVYLLPERAAHAPAPLARSMSFEQRSVFLQQLSHSSSTAPATLLSLPLADIGNVCGDAEKVGFHVRVLPSRDVNTLWVVLGTEEEAINLLAEKFLEEEERSTAAKARGRKLTAVAGGVVFGAVATWTGLAFS